MIQLLHRFLKDDTGNTAIEYCLITASIAVAVIAVLNGLALKLDATFSLVGSDAWRATWPPD
jgi:pilus assembly protein Flp/PilA